LLHLGHARCRRAGAGRIGKDMEEAEAAILHQAQTVLEHRFALGGKSGDQVGAEGNIGAKGARPPTEGDRIGPAVPPLHALQDQIVARLQREVEMGHQARLFGQELPERVIGLRRIEGRKPEARKLGDFAQQVAGHLPQLRPARQIAAIAADVDAGQHDLLDAGLDHRPRLGEDIGRRQAAVVPPREGDDAEGAAVIAALLDLQESAGMAREAGDAAGADPLGLHDLVDSQPGRGAQGHPGETPGVQFFLVAQDVIHFGHGGEGPRIELGRAAGDDDARQGIALTVPAEFRTPPAHAPVPQARVMPTPRSQTRMRSLLAPSRLATSMFARSGNSGWRSRTGPKAAISMDSASATKNTAWGLPILTPTPSANGPRPTSRWRVSIGLASGISRQSSRASPMSMVTRPSPAASASSSPTTVSMTTWPRPLSFMRRSATQRAPLPQASTSPPSALRMRMKASAMRFL